MIDGWIDYRSYVNGRMLDGCSIATAESMRHGKPQIVCTYSTKPRRVELSQVEYTQFISRASIGMRAQAHNILLLLLFTVITNVRVPLFVSLLAALPSRRITRLRFVMVRHNTVQCRY